MSRQKHRARGHCPPHARRHEADRVRDLRRNSGLQRDADSDFAVLARGHRAYDACVHYIRTTSPGPDPGQRLHHAIFEGTGLHVVYVSHLWSNDLAVIPAEVRPATSSDQPVSTDSTALTSGISMRSRCSIPAFSVRVDIGQA